MFSFRASFWNADVYINGQEKYAANEILTAYLNQADSILRINGIWNLKALRHDLMIEADMEYYRIEHYNSNVWEATAIFDRLNEALDRMPPYDRMFVRGHYLLPDLLNEHKELFDSRYDTDDIEFLDLRSFLYYDFWNGLRLNRLPTKCGQCGRYFLLEGGKYSRYCTNPLPDEPGKTCRDVGSKRRYDDRCKTDPVWQAYNRAYKAHYARYMKKKITAGEFEAWSRHASELRDRAAADKISFEEYCEVIKR